MDLIPITNWKALDCGEIAVTVASKSQEKFKLGAIIVDRRGRVLAVGYNKNKSHPRFGSGKFKMLHAEGAALLACEKLSIDPSGCSMYIFRKNGHISKPCKDCQLLIRKHKLNKVYYSVKSND